MYKTPRPVKWNTEGTVTMQEIDEDLITHTTTVDS